MKNKVRTSLLIISVIYSTTVILLMLYSFFTSTNTLSFNDDINNIRKLNSYKDELKSIDESICKSAINDLINYYEKTSYNGLVNLKDRYMDNDFLINYASRTFKDCNVDSDLKTKLSTKFLTASIQLDEIIKPLYFQYEIKIPDLHNRLVIEPDLNNTNYKINRKLILEIVGDLTNNLKGESLNV